MYSYAGGREKAVEGDGTLLVGVLLEVSVAKRKWSVRHCTFLKESVSKSDSG